jgi:FkbM family methyltransferase
MFKVFLYPLSNWRAKRNAALRTQVAPSVSAQNDEESMPIVKVRAGTTEVTYCTPNAVTKWRAQTLFMKEPDTIEWIKGFMPDDVLLDVGANVGLYTIWAAKTRKVRVYAFEPEAQNFALLNRNIAFNALGEKVFAYCAALSDEAGFSLLHLGTLSAGGSCHTFGQDLDHNLRERKSVFTQGCVSTTLDALVATGVMPVPTHIKIDVDGLEHKVLAGCLGTLQDRAVKSILVEINANLAEHRHIVDDLSALGFSYSADQVEAARRKEGAFEGVGNYVFRR